MPPWSEVLAIGLALAAGLALFYAVLPWLVRPFWRAVVFTRYRIRTVGLENIPARGPALLAANHVTWIDGFLLVAACPRRARFLIHAGYVNLPVIRHFARRCGLIPVPTRGPHAQRAAIQAAQQALDAGLVVGIFPEGQLSRTSMPGPFFRGFEVILKGRDAVPVVPAYLDNLWGSVLSHSDGRFFTKWPEGWRRTVGIAFGPPIFPPRNAFTVRQAVLEAGVHAFELHTGPRRPLETIDPAGPHLDHPELGRLAVSAHNFDKGPIQQIGQKPGSLGHPPPGVALRVVDDQGTPVTFEVLGRLEALVAGRPGWADTGLRASLDRDGFVRVERD